MWFGLAINAATGIGTTLLAGGLFEIRRRQKSTIWEMRVADLLVMTFAVCAILGLPQFGASPQRRDENRVNAISREFPIAVTGYTFGLGHRSSPIWLAPLSDERIDQWDGFFAARGLPTFTQVLGHPIPVTEIRVHGSAGLGEPPVPFDPRDLADRINELHALETMWLIGCNNDQMELLQHLDSTRIRSVHIYGLLGETYAQHLGALSRFDHLRRLELIDVDLEHPDFSAPKLDDLEELVVTADYVGEQALVWMADLPRLRVVYLQTQFRIKNHHEIRARLPRVYVTVDLQQPGGISAF